VLRRIMEGFTQPSYKVVRHIAPIVWPLKWFEGLDLLQAFGMSQPWWHHNH